MIKRGIKLILVIIWMGVIFMFSSDTAKESTKKSDGVIIKTIEVIFQRKLDDTEKEKYTKYFIVPVRKTAHFFVYFVLGILVFNYLSSFALDKKMLLLSILICFLYACSDEVHQLFVPGRSGEIKDVLLDSLGSISGILIYFKIRKGRCYE